MIVRKWVELSEEVEVNVSPEDVLRELWIEPESVPQILNAVNRVAGVMNAIPQERIDEMTPGQREVIRDFLSSMAAKFNSTK